MRLWTNGPLSILYPPRTIDIFNMVGMSCYNYEQHFSALLNSAFDVKTKACLLSVASSESGAWLGALPVPSLGTDESLWIALGLRLGVPIVAEHTCICGAVADIFGSHGLSCKRSGMLLSMKLSVVLWCLECTRCFGACGCMS